MAEENKDQKTEEATSKRITDTEEKGNFAHSKEVSSSFVLLSALVALSMMGGQGTKNMMVAWHNIFAEAHTVTLDIDGVYRVFVSTTQSAFLILAPLLVIIMVGGVAANVVQTRGLKFSIHPLKPRFDKLDPLKGFGRIFSKNSMAELVKSLFKVFIVAFIAYQTIRGRWQEIPPLMDFGVGQILVFMGEVALEIILKVLLVMIALSMLDYAFQRYTYLENIRMTKQEVRQERKETEGHPEIKQRIRTVQAEMARRRMMDAVPGADVVVTNPTEIAVAIRYDREKSQAPVVVAKGAGLIAEKIRDLARKSGVPVMENKPLARVLFKTVDIGQLIPESLYKAVAEILAYVYRLKGKSTV